MRIRPRPGAHRRALAAIAVVALGLTACAPGGGTDDGDDQPAPDDGDEAGGGDTGDGGDEEATGATSLRVTVWSGNEAHLALFDSIGQDFAAQHPTIEEVSFETLPFDSYNDALTIQLAGGNPPDLGWIFERNAPEFIEAGVLHDVGPSLRDDADYDFGDISEPALALWAQDDAVYGYPFSTSPFAVFYNADMFAEAGLDDPDALLANDAWTWDAAGDAGEQIVADGVAPHGLIVRDFDFNIWDNLATVWEGWGAAPWSDDGAQCQMSDPEMVEALSWFHELVFDRGAHPGPGQAADFFTGDAAMTITQISRASLFEEDGFEWGLVPLPAGPAGATPVVGQAGIGVFGASEARPEAIEFLKFWTNQTNSEDMAQFFPPPRTSLLTSEILAATNPLLSQEQLESVVIDGIATGDPIPSHPNFSQLRDTVRSELDALWEADADVAAVLDQVCGSIDPLLG